MAEESAEIKLSPRSTRRSAGNGNVSAIDASLLNPQQSASRDDHTPSRELLNELSAGSSVKVGNQFSSVSKKNSMAMDGLNDEINKNQTVADFVEIKVTTENQINQLFGQMEVATN
jgi:hypothetical protein